MDLSEQQREYFKDSKVRDTNGFLIPVYHGSGTRITQFSPDYTGHGKDQYGSGFYFTTSEEVAMGYTAARADGEKLKKLWGGDAPSVVSAYVNLKNPLMIDGRENPNLSHIYLTAEQSHEILKQLPSLYYPLDSFDSNEVESNPMGDYLESIWESNPQSVEEFEPYIERMAYEYFSDTDMRTLDIMFVQHPSEFREAVKETLGYDGIIVDFEEQKHVIAWFPQQIKDVRNREPRETPFLMDGPSEEKIRAEDYENLKTQPSDNERIDDEWEFEL